MKCTCNDWKRIEMINWQVCRPCSSFCFGESILVMCNWLEFYYLMLKYSEISFWTCWVSSVEISFTWLDWSGEKVSRAGAFWIDWEISSRLNGFLVADDSVDWFWSLVASWASILDLMRSCSESRCFCWASRVRRWFSAACSASCVLWASSEMVLSWVSSSESF